MMAAVSLLTMLILLVAVGILSLAVRHLVLHRQDPKYSSRRIVGVTIEIVGALLFALGVAYFIAMLFEGDGPILEAHSDLYGFGHPSYHGGVSQLVGLNTLSVWLLLAGAAIGLGVSINRERFSLRTLVTVLGLVAFTASIPHMLIRPRDPQAVISVESDRILNAEEWGALERALSREGLCAAVSDETKKALPCPMANALTAVDLQPMDSEDYPMKAERHGPLGVRLTLRFAYELNREQIEGLFDELMAYVQRAMQNQTAN